MTTKQIPFWQPFPYGNKFTVAHDDLHRADPFRCKTLEEARAEADRRNKLNAHTAECQTLGLFA